MLDQFDYDLYERPLAKALDRCDECGDDICEGEEYYYIENVTICLDCIDKFKKEAEYA